MYVRPDRANAGLTHTAPPNGNRSSVSWWAVAASPTHCWIVGRRKGFPVFPSGGEAPVRIELTNSRFAVCRLTTWPRRRTRKLSGSQSPEQSCREYPERQTRTHYHDQRQQRRGYCCRNAAPFARRCSPRQVTIEQCDVFCIRLPRRVEHIAECGHRPDESVDADVDEHPCQRKRRDFGTRRFENDVTRQHRAQQIANSRDQSDDWVQPNPVPRTGNRDRVVEQLRQGPQPTRSTSYIVAENSTAFFDCHARIASAHRDVFASSAD